MRNSLHMRLTIIFIGLAVLPVLVLGIDTVTRTQRVQRQQAVDAQLEAARRVATQVESFIRDREDELRLITEVGGLQELDREQQINQLSSLLFHQDVYDELILIDPLGREEIRFSRLDLVDDTGDTRTYTGEEFFEQPQSSSEVYFSSVQFDEQTGEPSMIIALPLFNLRTGEFNGVLAANFRFKPVWDLMARAQLPGSGIVYVSDADNRVIAHRNPSIVLQGTQVNLPDQNTFTTGLQGIEVAQAKEQIVLGEQVFNVVTEVPASEALALATRATYSTVAAVLAAILAASFLGFFAARRITRPIRELSLTAESISRGDLSQQVEVTGQDEIGTLAAAFNSMTVQLRELIDSLEQRVANRTRALEISREVSRSLSTILETEQLVIQVVEQVRSAFNYYHAHIYLFDESNQDLLMVGGTGEAGQQMLASGHKIQKGKGLVGRTAETNEVALVPDVTQAKDWLPNPLLPDTRAEIAVPIARGEQVLGVLDVQHNVTDGLTQQDVDLLQSVASQVAVALRNAYIYEQAQQQAEREALINMIAQKIQQATSIENVLQITARELGQALRVQQTKVQLGSKAQPRNGHE